MTSRLALKIILAISLFGAAFSGTLTYREFFGVKTVGCAGISAPGTILGYPPCVYGLIMYTIIVIIAVWGLAKKPAV